MEQFESVIRDSISHYKKILILLQNIEKSIGIASEDELQNMSTSLVELQDQTKQLDQMIMDQLNSQPARRTDAVDSLLITRKKIVKEILLLNSVITAKAIGVKSLLAHEIGTIRSGRSALSGYKQQQHNQGRIVNSTS